MLRSTPDSVLFFGHTAFATSPNKFKVTATCSSIAIAKSSTGYRWWICPEPTFIQSTFLDVDVFSKPTGMYGLIVGGFTVHCLELPEPVFRNSPFTTIAGFFLPESGTVSEDMTAQDLNMSH